MQQRHLDHERDIALRLQRSMLASKLPVELHGLHVACRYRAAGEGIRVGGDWYDIVARADGARACHHRRRRQKGHRRSHPDGPSCAARSTPTPTITPRPRTCSCVCSASPLWRHGDRRLRQHRPKRAPRIPESNLTNFSLHMADRCRSRCTSGAARRRQKSPRRTAARTAKVVLAVGSALIAYTDGLILERRTESIDVGIGRSRPHASLRAARSARGRACRGRCSRMSENFACDRGRRGAARRQARRRPAAASRSSSPPRRRCCQGCVAAWGMTSVVVEARRGACYLAISEACSNSIEHGYLQSRGRDRSESRARRRRAPDRRPAIADAGGCVAPAGSRLWARPRDHVLLRRARSVDVAADEDGFT